MKYPDTLHCASLSRVGVIVSTADRLFSNEVSYCITTYSPSGAPGNDVWYCARFNLRDITLPNGPRAARTFCNHSSLVIASLNMLAALS